jgi:hypothetical protein
MDNPSFVNEDRVATVIDDAPAPPLPVVQN